MKKVFGTVMEIEIPEQYNNGSLLDVMDRNLILFKVMTEDGLIDVVVEQNEENSLILKDDDVVIIYQTISGKEYVDIRLDEGEEDE